MEIGETILGNVFCENLFPYKNFERILKTKPLFNWFSPKNECDERIGSSMF